MSHAEKLLEVFKQLAYLQLEALKQLSEEQINELYETRPFKEKDKEVTDDELYHLYEIYCKINLSEGKEILPFRLWIEKFYPDGKVNVPDEKNEPHDEEIAKQFGDIIDNY